MKRYARLLSLLAFFAAKASAHDPDTGEANWITHGNYTSQAGVHCCGEKDCRRLDASAVTETPAGIHVHYQLWGNSGPMIDEVVPYSEATPSEDGHYWRCHTWENGVNKRRCFFAPVGTE